MNHIRREPLRAWAWLAVLILGFASPALAQVSQTADALRSQIASLDEQIASYDALPLYDHRVILVQQSVLAQLDPSLNDGRETVPVTPEDLLRIATLYVTLEGPQGAPFADWLRGILDYDRTVRDGLIAEVSSLRQRREALAVQLAALGAPTPDPTLQPGPVGDGWFGSWSVTSTHTSGDPSLIGQNFTSTLTVSAAPEGCTASVGGTRMSICTLSGDMLSLTGTHPSGGVVRWSFDLVGDGSTLVGEFSGTVNGYSNAAGTYEGRRN